MILRRTLLALAAIASLASAAHAQAPTPVAAPPPAPPTNPRVIITTEVGTITVELAADKAPITTANFLKYVDRKLYDGSKFYRASKPKGQVANDYGTIQGGLQNDPNPLAQPASTPSSALGSTRSTSESEVVKK